jgi:hypothetical protein
VKGTIFYSWQSDQPATKKLIEKALNAAVKALSKDDSLVVEPAVDRALSEAAGAVRIDHDILDRIASETCVAFVGDMTLVTPKGADGRPSPNPNVLFELGYALRGLGWPRIILPFNEAFGDKRDLPFDLDKNRLLLFGADAEEESTVTIKRLTERFQEALKLILRLPGARERIVSWLDETHPGIVKAVRAGQMKVSVNITPHRVPGLIALQKLRGADALLLVQSNGNLVQQGSSVGGFNDLAGGLMSGYNLTFKGDPSEW